MTHGFRVLKQAAVAASLALCGPMFAHAQAGPGTGPGAGMEQGRGMMQHGGMQHGDMQGMRGRHGARGEDMGMGGGMRMLSALNLTEAQRDQVFSLMHKQAPAMREQAKGMHKARQELRKLSMSAQYDDARAKSLADGIAAATAEMALARARTAQEIYRLLTPEQRKQADDQQARFEQRGAMDGHRPGAMDGHRPGAMR